jgi:hypothetical protein
MNLHPTGKSLANLELRHQAHQPTEEVRKIVFEAAKYGLPQKQIAEAIGIDRKTLAKHYRPELRRGKIEANIAVGKALFEKAIAGDTTALIWWAKTQMGWSETVKVKTEPPAPDDISLIEAARRMVFLLANAEKRLEEKEAEKLAVVASPNTSMPALR